MQAASQVLKAETLRLSFLLLLQPQVWLSQRAYSSVADGEWLAAGGESEGNSD